MVSTGERLERHEAGVRALEQRRGCRRYRAGEPLCGQLSPAERRPVQPVRHFDGALGSAMVLDRGEGGERRFEAVSPTRPDGTAQLGWRQYRKSTGASASPVGPVGAAGDGCQRPNQARERPTVGFGQRIAPAWAGKPRRASKLSSERGAELRPASSGPLARSPTAPPPAVERLRGRARPAPPKPRRGDGAIACGRI